MAWRAAFRRLEGQRGNREGRRRTLLPTTVHARAGPDSGRGLLGALWLLETCAFFRLSGAYTPTPVPEQILRRKIHFPWANCLFCACLSPVFDQSGVWNLLARALRSPGRLLA